jgi:nitrogen fixation/metabolism regulation signal transduction histidine kinase
MKMLFHSLDLKFPPEDPRARDAEIMSEKMDHLNKIVDHLLGYARSTEPTFDLVDVNDLLDDVLLLTRQKLRQNNRVGEQVRRRPAQGARRPRPDRAGLLNLILNAADAMSAAAR